jgi:CubicO group peptidase (beta-lactamase class C family)
MAHCRPQPSRNPGDPYEEAIRRGRIRVLLALCSFAAPGGVTPSGSARQLQADTVLTTADGATFEAAKGWFVSTDHGRLTLEDPDRELSIVFLSVTGADGQQAIAEGWRQVRPDFVRSVRHTAVPPPQEGWDEIMQIIYETTTEEQRTVTAVARRKGEHWYLALLNAADAALDRRGAQVGTALSSFKAPGVEEETFAGKKAHVLDKDRLAVFEAFVEEARVASDVPGVAVAIVQDGRVVYEKGLGGRELGKDAPVTPETLFLIGSTTKSLTTFMMARLVDEGRLEWDQPVVEAFPSFALGDPDVTRKLTMRHTVCACTGLPRQDMEFLFEFSSATPEQQVESLRTMKPTTGFGETFQYSNPLVSTGGYLAAHAAVPDRPLGEAYDQVMQSRVFDALGMAQTTFDFDVATKHQPAMPHGADLHLTMGRIDLGIEHALYAVRPAGGAWSSARDMARYLQVELSKGIGPDGKRVVSEANLLERRVPQVKITEEMSYGLGLFVQMDHGVQVIHHGGNTLGFTSDMFFLPENGVGAVVLTNAANANALRNTVRRRLLEVLFDGNDLAKKNLTYALAQREKVMAKEREDVNFAPDAAWLGKFAGAYRHPALGRVDVRVADGVGTFDTGEWRSPLGRRFGADQVDKLVLTGAPWAGLELLPGTKNGSTTLTLQLAQQEYTFEPVR